MIVLIGGEKGGTGKTTLVTNLAALRARQGYDVLIIDTDKQESANFWTFTRDENHNVPRVACIQKFGKGILKEVQDLSNRYEEIIIDAGGRDSVELRSSMTVAHCMYIPIQASQFDVWTLTSANELVQQAQTFNTNLSANIIINRASPNPVVTESLEVMKLLDDFDKLNFSGIIVHERIAYRKAVSNGLSVVELKPSDLKAIVEMHKFYEEVYNEKAPH